jgi:hypothetical protein
VAETAHIHRDPDGIARLRNYIGMIHNSIVDDVEWDARMHAAVRTGAMLATIHSRRIRPLLSWVVVDTDHWQYVEYSTRAHEIRARPPHRALFWSGAPHPVQVVHHPGTIEQPFMRPALYQRRSLRGRP